MLQQVRAHTVGIGLRFVDFVDRNDDRHAGGLGVVQRFDGLRHHAVVGRDDQNDDVRHLGAALAHRSEGFVARRIDERDLVARGRQHLISADVLRNTASFARDDIG